MYSDLERQLEASDEKIKHLQQQASCPLTPQEERTSALAQIELDFVRHCFIRHQTSARARMTRMTVSALMHRYWWKRYFCVDFALLRANLQNRYQRRCGRWARSHTNQPYRAVWRSLSRSPTLSFSHLLNTGHSVCGNHLTVQLKGPV